MLHHAYFDKFIISRAFPSPIANFWHQSCTFPHWMTFNFLTDTKIPPVLQPSYQDSHFSMKSCTGCPYFCTLVHKTTPLSYLRQIKLIMLNCLVWTIISPLFWTQQSNTYGSKTIPDYNNSIFFMLKDIFMSLSHTKHVAY